jgi:hypothetical protein
LCAELEVAFGAGVAGFAAREGAILLRNFANIFFNMTIEARKRLRIAGLCNPHVPMKSSKQCGRVDKRQGRR